MVTSPGLLLLTMRTFRARPIRWLAGLIVAVAFLVVFAPTTLGGATSYVIVSGSSMSPTFSDGDLVVVRKGDYDVGDIVAFETGRGLVIHRIVGGSGDEGFVVQGDNKESPDSWSPTEADIIGEHFAQIPDAGHWVQRVTTSPVLLGVTVGGLGSLMLWSPRRGRKRRGAHAAGDSRRSNRPGSRVASMRGAGPTLLILATLALLLAGAATFLMLRPLERVGTVEQVRFEHTGEFTYTALVDNSVVYDSERITSPPDGSEPTAIYTALLNDLQVDYAYTLASPPPPGVRGALSADLRIGAGEGLWTRTIPLLSPQEFEGSQASGSFAVDIEEVLAMVARAEEQTGFAPGVYQLVVVTRLDLQDDTSGSTSQPFLAELALELRDKLLLVTNELTASETVTDSEEVVVANDLEFFGVSIPIRSARAGTAAALAMLIVGGGIYAVGVRRRLGKGEVARIRLRYGPLIVPVAGAAPNGTRPVDVSSMADLARIARRAEQMVFYDQRSSGEHWFFVPDGPVTYQYQVPTGDESRE